MGKKTKKTKKPGKGKEKAAKAEEKRARRETSSSHLRMTSMPSRPYGTIMEGVKLGGLLIKDMEFLVLIL
ncbi:unnamed protein product [Prunus armeniaca]